MLRRSLPDRAAEGRLQAPVGLRSYAQCMYIGRARKTGPSRNTVQLGWPRECLDGLAGPSDGLGPVAVAGAFDAVVAHLAFDDAGCGAQASCRQQFPADLGD